MFVTVYVSLVYLLPILVSLFSFSSKYLLVYFGFVCLILFIVFLGVWLLVDCVRFVFNLVVYFDRLFSLTVVYVVLGCFGVCFA